MNNHHGYQVGDEVLFRCTITSGGEKWEEWVPAIVDRLVPRNRIRVVLKDCRAYANVLADNLRRV